MWDFVTRLTQNQAQHWRLTNRVSTCSVCLWWRYQMEAFSTLLVLCAGNSPVTGDFPSQSPVMWSFGVFFDLSQNKRLSKQSKRRWSETLSRSFCHHCNAEQLNVGFCSWCSSQWIHVFFYSTVQCHYNAVNFLPNSHCKETPHSSAVRASYRVYFFSSNFDLSSVFVIGKLYGISCHDRSRFNDTWLYS